MRRIVASEYVTLDGIMDDLDLWYGPFWSEEASNFKRRELFASDTLLLGRGTYEEFVTFWPTAQGMGDYGERMNNLPKYVASTTLGTVEWNARLIRGSVVNAVSELKRQPGQDVLVFGSGQLLDTLMQHNLIDEYRLMVHPFIAGRGKRLFREGSEKRALKLVETTPFSSGVVALTYRPDNR